MTEARAERAVTRVLNAIPGYSGYRDKESRRDADRRVRDRLFAELNLRAERVERIAAKLADARKIREVGPVNALAGDIRHLANRINTATYGYGGLFGDRDVNAAVLDQLRLFDESLFAGIEQIDAAISKLESAGDAETAAATEEGKAAVGAVTSRLELRNQVLESATAATPEQMSNVLAVLQSPEERRAAELPPPAYNLHDRDALAVMGDNYVVDAKIDIESANGSFRLFRVDVAPDTWLLVSQKQGGAFALVSPSKEAYQPAPQSKIGADSFDLEASGTGSGEVIGASGETGRRPVAYTLLRGATDPKQRAVVLQWGGEQHVYVGSEVHPQDVEIFGKPS
jgi:hypothetical protein